MLDIFYGKKERSEFEENYYQAAKIIIGMISRYQKIPGGSLLFQVAYRSAEKFADEFPEEFLMMQEHLNGGD